MTARRLYDSDEENHTPEREIKRLRLGHTASQEGEVEQQESELADSEEEDALLDSAPLEVGSDG